MLVQCAFSLECLVRIPMCLSPIAGFSYIYILQGSVAMQLKCNGIFSYHFIANCTKSVTVIEF